MRIPFRDSAGLRRARRGLHAPGLAILCLAVFLGFGTSAPTAAAEETVVAANLWDILRGSKEIDEPKAKPKKKKTKPKKRPAKVKPAKKKRKRRADPKKQVNPGATRLAVIGDSLAQDLWFGIQRQFRKNKDVDIIRLNKSASGLVRDDNYDWNKKLKAFIDKEDFDIAVVVFGGNDRQEIRLRGKRLPRFTEAWTAEYGDRVTKIISLLQTEADTVFWVGLPVVRSDRMEKDYKKLNKVYREKSEAAGIEFVDIWHLFRDASGAYTSFGPDLRGAKRRLRQDDGLHFTAHGQGRFADEVVKVMNTIVQLSGLRQPMRHAAMKISVPQFPVPGGH
jgi:hypothetical protein